MDVLEHTRDIGVDEAPLDPASVGGARQALLREIAREGRAPSRGRRRWAGGFVAAGGVAATAIALTVFSPVHVDPAAAAVLERAAAVTITAIDTQLAPGQYLRIQTDNETLWRWDAGMGDDADARFSNGDRGAAEAGVVVNETRVLYIPADRAGVWVWDWSAPAEAIATYGNRTDEAVADWESSQRAADSGYWPDIQLLPDGNVPAPEGDTHTYPIDSYRALYSEMPRDPQALLDWFRDRSGTPEVSDQWVVDAIAESLSANLMPADLRAATLLALALVPDIQVSRVSDDQTTLVYESGDWLSTRTTEITIDTSLGMITAVSQGTSGLFGASGAIPKSVPDSRVVVTTSVADSAPTP